MLPLAYMHLQGSEVHTLGCQRRVGKPRFPTLQHFKPRNKCGNVFAFPASKCGPEQKYSLIVFLCELMWQAFMFEAQNITWKVFGMADFCV